MKVKIYGAGGFGKEVKGMIELDPDLSFDTFLDDFNPNFKNQALSNLDNLLIAIAEPSNRKEIYERSNESNVNFITFLHKDLNFHPSIKIGKGCIICPGVKCTVDIEIGDFVIINLNSVIGHDVKIGNYCSIMPSVNIAGNVILGEGVFVGTGAMILQGVNIGSNAIIGAGSLVRNDVEAGSTVVGIPAKELKR